MKSTGDRKCDGKGRFTNVQGITRTGLRHRAGASQHLRKLSVIPGPSLYRWGSASSGGVHCSGPPPLWNYLCWYTTLVTQTHPLQTPCDTVSCQSGPGAGKEAETVAAWNLLLLFPLNMFLIYYTHIIISSDETKYITYLHNRWSKGFVHSLHIFNSLNFPTRIGRSPIFYLVLTWEKLQLRSVYITDHFANQSSKVGK